MLETISTVYEKDESGFFDHLCHCRLEAANIFPYAAHGADEYIERVNGCKLSKASVEALHRD